MKGFYAGIGSRETPDDILALMERIGAKLSEQQWMLRTGAAPGADQAFLRGAVSQHRGNAVAFLPWDSFEEEFIEKYGIDTLTQPAAWTYEIAREHHPAWDRLSEAEKKLHARNVHQILGLMTWSKISSFVVCWTKDGKHSGGTGQALRIATHYEVPIFNLQREQDRERLEAFIS